VKFQRFLWERKNDHWSQFEDGSVSPCVTICHNGVTLILRISNEEQWNKTEIGQMSMIVTLGVIVTAVCRLALRACNVDFRKPEVLYLGSLRLSHDEDRGQLKPLDPRCFGICSKLWIYNVSYNCVSRFII
jgi:hypothetical protein